MVFNFEFVHVFEAFQIYVCGLKLNVLPVQYVYQLKKQNFSYIRIHIFTTTGSNLNDQKYEIIHIIKAKLIPKDFLKFSKFHWGNKNGGKYLTKSQRSIWISDVNRNRPQNPQERQFFFYFFGMVWG